MSDPILFRGEHMSPADRERDRWVSLAFCAAVIAGKPADEQPVFLRIMLKKFADVANRYQDEPGDMLACAKSAVKMLLHVLTSDDPATALAGDLVSRHFFDKLRK